MPASRSAKIRCRSGCGSHLVFSGVDTTADQSATQPNPIAPVMMNDQRHDATSISHATNGAPSANPRLEPAEIAPIAVPRSV